jgi:hypothetical protein
LADGPLEYNGYDSWNVMDKYIQWMREGAIAPILTISEGISIQTADMLDRFAEVMQLSTKTKSEVTVLATAQLCSLSL